MDPAVGRTQPAIAAHPACRSNAPRDVAVWLRAELRADRDIADHERHAGSATCAALAGLDPWLPRRVVSVASLSGDATREARPAGPAGWFAIAIRRGFSADEASRRGNACCSPCARFETADAPACARYVAPQSRLA